MFMIKVNYFKVRHLLMEML